VLILAVALMIVVVIARLSGATTMAEQYFAQVAANAGFKVVNVVPRGTVRLNEARIYEVALGREDLSMVLVDLDGLRTELLALNWVKDARVSRQLPDTLVIDIIEREPHAVLRRADRLVLIDATGAELEPIAAASVGEMLVISGEGAQGQVQALDDLLDNAPALVPLIKGAEWVGNRRWNLTFRTDQQLALPEGDDRASAALISFAQADGVHRLVGGEVVRFDMRNAPRMFLSVPGRAESELDLHDGEDS
jgi:cell division protein FtsQ